MIKQPLASSPLSLPPSRSISPMSYFTSGLHVSTINSNGIFAMNAINNTSRHTNIANFFHRNNLDVMGIQEHHLSTEQSQVLNVREHEIGYVCPHNLIDAYLSLHEGRLVGVPPEGYTWGFPEMKPNTPAIHTDASVVEQTTTNRHIRIDHVTEG